MHEFISRGGEKIINKGLNRGYRSAPAVGGSQLEEVMPGRCRRRLALVARAAWPPPLAPRCPLLWRVRREAHHPMPAIQPHDEVRTLSGDQLSRRMTNLPFVENDCARRER
eukprot:scaffold2250_cov399-Prasinococcus_capsulatus_cf.AAC.9